MIKYKMKFKSLLLIIAVVGISCNSKPGEKKGINEVASTVEKTANALEIIDISQKQLALYNMHQDTDSAIRAKIFRDSLYYPYQDIWDGYVNGRETFDLVAEHYGIRKIAELNEKNKLFYSKKNNGALLDAFFKVRDGMEKLTGHKPKGKWYLLYGPSLANLGGVGEGVMFIDFAFPENKNLKSVINWFPHELNHQILSNTSIDTSHNVLARCIDEGFATYVNKLYWNNIEGNKDYSLAMSLSYSEEELKAADEDWDFVLTFFKENYLSVDKSIINKFGAQNEKLKENLPGKIGYLIGYRIVENYVGLHGSDSWKDIYDLSFEELLDKSEFLEQ